MIIGTFEKNGADFFGRITTATQDIPASIKAVKTNGKEGAPTHRIFAKARSGIDLGAGWLNKSDKTGNDYLSVKLDDPFLPTAIKANLVEQEGETGKFILIWTRD